MDKSLYAPGPDSYLSIMHDLLDEYARALIIGHNPGLEELVEMLAGEIHLMPTCSLAHVKLHVDKWSEIDNKIKGKVASYVASARSHLTLISKRRHSPA